MCRLFQILSPIYKRIQNRSNCKILPKLLTGPDNLQRGIRYTHRTGTRTNIKNLKKRESLRITPTYKEKLVELAKIFNDALPKHKQNTVPEPEYKTPPRVNSPPRVKESPRVTKSNPLTHPTNSTQPTRPDIMQQIPFTHKRHTRNNKPILQQPNDDDSTFGRTPLR